MRRKAIIFAVTTTFLWSGSYILNKLAFQGNIGPLTLSGLRYLIASLFLIALGKEKRQKGDDKFSPWLIIVLGLLGYSLAQGLQYLGQSYLTPTQSSLLLSVGNTICIMLADMVWLRENQTKQDFVKLLFLIVGIAVFYYPWGTSSFSAAGMIFMFLSSIGYALNMTLNRRLLTGKKIRAGALTAQPMLVGAVVLLAAGIVVEGIPTITYQLLLILAYLSLASGALGFSLWTHSQKHLTAFESSSINNFMLIEIALLDLFVFNRSFSIHQIIGIMIVFGAILSIQFKRKITARDKTYQIKPSKQEELL